MSRYIGGNRLTLLRSGTQYFPALIDAIEQARAAVFIETYIFADDATGARVARSLEAAAARGVAVYVVIDAYGARGYVTEALLQRLRAGGVQVGLFRPDVMSQRFQRARMRRMHRKLALIDGDVAFVGGINLIDDHHTPRHNPPRVDFAVKVEGPILQDVAAAMTRLWNVVRLSQPGGPLRASEQVDPLGHPVGHQIAKLAVRDNLRFRREIELAYYAGLRAAKRDVIIANAYFFPGLNFRYALLNTRRRGVRVRLLLQGHTEYWLAQQATRALYSQLLDGGIEIYEYHASFLHAKVAVVDDHWCTVGSSNIDPFSLLLAREANLFVRDSAFTQELRVELEQLIESGAKRVTSDGWRKRTWGTRVAHWSAYAAARALIGFYVPGGAVNEPESDTPGVS